MSNFNKINGYYVEDSFARETIGDNKESNYHKFFGNLKLVEALIELKNEILKKDSEVFNLTEGKTITPKQKNTIVILNSTPREVNIVLENAQTIDTTVTFINTTVFTHSLSRLSTDNRLTTIKPNTYFDLKWNGIAWVNSTYNQIVNYFNNTCPFPVGAVYTQYPECKAPAELWSGTKWEKLDFRGAFFRSSGGNAQAFDNQTAMQAQGTAVNNLKITLTDPGHSHSVAASQQTVSNRNYFPLVSDGPTKNVSIVNSSTTGITVFLSSKDSETRPINYTFQIWRRTA